jgi:uncharacterized protein (DUF885 family)
VSQLRRERHGVTVDTEFAWPSSIVAPPEVQMRCSLVLSSIVVAFVACNDAAPPPATPVTGPVPVTPGGQHGPAPVATPSDARPDLETRRAALRAVIAEDWEARLVHEPEFASILGDKRYNDRWNDPSEKAIYAYLDQEKVYAAKLRAIDTTGFPEQERLNQVLLLRTIDLMLEEAKFEPWLMQVNQFSSPHLDLPQLVSFLQFTSVKDYDDYIARLRAIPAHLSEIIVNSRKGVAKNLVPPKILLSKVVKQSTDIATHSPSDSAFAGPLKSFPASVPEADRARIKKAVLDAIDKNVNPAYLSFAAFVRDEYAPKGRADPGVWSLPMGEARYAFSIKDETTTTESADAIHELGLREVARIEGHMQEVMKKLGYATLPELAAAIAKDPKRHFASRQAVVDLYRHYTDQMYGKLPSLFGRLPKAKLEIMPVETFREKGAAAAEYDQGTPDGSRPGHVMVNTGEFAKRTTTNAETTAYHEGVPGHHLQIALAQEIDGLPPYRQQYSVTSFIEGWALYSERLGEEVGFYEDPYSYYGHLQDEMLRAIRLVVDTGLHAKRWTRQQVVDFFHAHGTMDEVDVQSETDRYIAVPGQALAYKIGQLRILALREKAKKALGDRFDLRAFHDVVLGSGALPLDVLEEQVDRWVASSGASPSH